MLIIGMGTGADLPGGRVVSFDQFAPEDGKFTIGRRLSDLIPASRGQAAGTGARILGDEPGLLGGAYLIILMDKNT